MTGVADIIIGAPGTGSGSMGRFQSVAGARNATRKAAGCMNTARNAAGARLGGKTFFRRYGETGVADIIVGAPGTGSGSRGRFQNLQEPGTLPGTLREPGTLPGTLREPGAVPGTLLEPGS